MALDMIDSDFELVGAEPLRPEPRLVVALDKPTTAEAWALVNVLGDEVSEYKVGLELLFAGGLTLAQELKARGKDVFLDMKLLDIPNTVEKSVANIARLGFDFLTVHGVDRKTLKAAIRGRDSIPGQKDKSRLKLLSVTVMTSLVDADLQEQGISEGCLALSVRRARMAFEEGFDGVIASSHEARAIRKVTAPDFIIKVPGIRPSGSAIGDQSRAMTPRQALDEGASYLVVGRPIYDAVNPVAMARQIKREMAN